MQPSVILQCHCQWLLNGHEQVLMFFGQSAAFLRNQSKQTESTMRATEWRDQQSRKFVGDLLQGSQRRLLLLPRIHSHQLAALNPGRKLSELFFGQLIIGPRL